MRDRGALMLVAVGVVAAAAAVAFVLLAERPDETLTAQDVGSATAVTATPLSGSVRAQDGADRLLQRERTGSPCGVSQGAVPAMGCPLSTPIRMVALFLVRDPADSIRAFIGEDPRNGCALAWRPEVQGGVFLDVCHASLYDLLGRVVGGPSPWNLNEWAVEIKDGKVFVDPSKIIPGQSRATQVMGPNDAIRVVLASSSVVAGPAIFPRSVGSQTCQIRGGGPPPGIVVPGTCKTEVEASGSNYVVRFVETWDASRFHYAGEPSSGELQHTWSFVVSSSGVVVAQPESGNFPPQYVM
jgi:Rieske Fe-S protein